MDAYREFLEIAQQALAAGAAVDLGLADLLAGDADGGTQAAAYALAQAEGWAGADTDILSRIALATLDIPGPAVKLAAPVRGLPTGALLALGPDTGEILVDLVGTGLVTAPSGGLPAGWGSGAIGLATQARGCVPDLTAARILIAEADYSACRDGVLARLRLGASAMLVGVMDRMIAGAVDHVRVREQFGKPLASFPQIRDMLAWAATERHQTNELLRATLSGAPICSPDPDTAVLVKALAGNSALRVAQLTMQVTGAIAFTEEHLHARLHDRVLILEQVGGSSGDLNRELGAQLRATGEVRGLLPLEQLAASVA